MRRGRYPNDRQRSRRGLTLVEVSVCMVLVGGLLVTALTTVGASKRNCQLRCDRTHGMLLARALLDEALQQAYLEPDLGFPVLDGGIVVLRLLDDMGRDSGESGGSREDFDDVDDYHDWSESPPEYKDGSEMKGLAGWTRSSSVKLVHPSTLQALTGQDRGLIEVTVTVKLGATKLAQISGLKSLGLPGDHAAVCRNDVCEPGETCDTCPEDCPMVISGPLARRHCCGNGLLELQEGDGTICDGNP